MPNPFEVISQTETDMNDKEQIDQEELHIILQDDNISKEELVAAYLTAFYQCDPTRRTLTITRTLGIVVHILKFDLLKNRFQHECGLISIVEVTKRKK